MTDLRLGWKILTHDGRSPMQGGPPLLNGHFPITLPTVALDTGPNDCAAGWNFVADIPTGWQIAGMWPTGRPARIIAVEATADAIQRGTKRRASSLTLLREATEEERTVAFRDFSRPFGTHQARMATEQAAWWTALTRPHRDPAEVEAQLALALSARGLLWNLQKHETAGAAGDARAAWDAWAAGAAGDAGDAWAARAARDAWDAGAAGDAWAAWAAGDARAAWDAGDAWDARAALTTFFARLMGLQDGEPDQYTVGIRDAYRAGLGIALPGPNNTLLWAMDE